MSNWQLTVGMEIHVELETKTKMFCGCPNDPFHSAPNTNVCPVCYGLPGALPLLNKKAVELVVRFGQAIKAETPKESFWARKNYFYPDLPKGYQISQSALPLVQGGKISIDGTDYHLDHAHLEEDSGKLMHAADKTHSLVNYNRAGVPLLEIVTEPDFHTAEAAARFCQELQRITRSLKVSSADMEKGQMRCEANISVAKDGEPLGTKVEVKNINSFRSVKRAIEFEFTRQTQALEVGEKLVQETRTWNEIEGKTVSMRTKETSADYRYFPEPDLPVVAIVVEAGDDQLLPDEQRKKVAELGLHKEIIQALIDRGGFDFVVRIMDEDRELAVDASKLFLAIPQLSKLPFDQQLQVLKVRRRDNLPTSGLMDIVKKAEETGQTIAEIMESSGQIDLPAVIQEVLSANPDVVTSYKNGKEAVFQFLVGQVMAKTQGRANIQTVRSELQKALTA